MTFVALFWLSHITFVENDVSRRMICVAYDVCRLTILVAYDFCWIMTFVTFFVWCVAYDVAGSGKVLHKVNQIARWSPAVQRSAGSRHPGLGGHAAPGYGPRRNESQEGVCTVLTDYSLSCCRFCYHVCINSFFYKVLWIRIRIGSLFRSRSKYRIK